MTPGTEDTDRGLGDRQSSTSSRQRKRKGGVARGERGARSRTCQDSQWLVVVVAVQLLLVLVVLHLLHPRGVGHHCWRQREHDRPVVMMEHHKTITTAQPVSHLVVRTPCLTVGGRPPPYPALVKTNVWGIVHAATHRLGRLRSSCPTILATAASSTRRRFTPADRYRPWGGHIRGGEVQIGGQSGRVRRQPRNGLRRFGMKVYGMCNMGEVKVSGAYRIGGGLDGRGDGARGGRGRQRGSGGAGGGGRCQGGGAGRRVLRLGLMEQRAGGGVSCLMQS